MGVGKGWGVRWGEGGRDAGWWGRVASRQFFVPQSKSAFHPFNSISSPLISHSPHILVLGGSLGAPRLTEAAAGAMRRLQRRYPDLRATVQTGRGRGRGGLGDLQASVQAGQAEGWCVNGAGEGTGEWEG